MLNLRLSGLRRAESSEAEASPEDGEPPGSTDPSVIQVDDRSFTETILKSPLPALVYVWAPWSGLSRQISSTVTSLAEEFQGRVIIAQLNAEDSPDLLAQLRVSTVPTLVLFKEGQELMRVVGQAPKGSLRSMLGAA